jgi:hypothetical protein
LFQIFEMTAPAEEEVDWTVEVHRVPENNAQLSCCIRQYRQKLFASIFQSCKAIFALHHRIVHHGDTREQIQSRVAELEKLIQAAYSAYLSLSVFLDWGKVVIRFRDTSLPD